MGPVEHFLFLWSLVPVSIAEGNEALWDPGAHTCGTLDFLGIDLVLHRLVLNISV